MFSKILIPLDGSALAQSALPYAERLAERFGAELLFLRVVAPPMFPTVEYGAAHPDLVAELHERQLETARDYLRSLGDVPELAAFEPRVLLREGDVAETILEVTQRYGVDTIVMATHGRGGLSRWVLGSVADRVVRSASVPVLLVRAGVAPTDDESVASVQSEPYHSASLS